MNAGNVAVSQVIFGLHKAGFRFGDTLVIQAAAVAKDMGASVVKEVPERRDRVNLVRPLPTPR